jgi:hypothetical protein
MLAVVRSSSLAASYVSRTPDALCGASGYRLPRRRWSRVRALLARRASWPLSVFAAAMLVLGSRVTRAHLDDRSAPAARVPGSPGVLARAKGRNLGIVLGILALSGWHAVWQPFISGPGYPRHPIG